MSVTIGSLGGLRVSNSGAKLEYPFTTDTGAIIVVVFATRYGAQFTDDKINAPWLILERFRAYAPEFADEEIWYVAVVRKGAAGTAPPGGYDIITEHRDVIGVPTTAPWLVRELRNNRTIQGGLDPDDPAASVYFAQDRVDGYRTDTPFLPWTPPGGYPWGQADLTHVTKQDASWIRISGYESGYYKSRRTGWHSNLTGARVPDDLVTKQTLTWSDGQATERVTLGADTVLQRMIVGISGAPATPGKPLIVMPESPAWVDVAQAATIPWTAYMGLAGTQAAYELRDTAGTTRYWNQATIAWQAGAPATSNVRTVPNAVLPVGALAQDTPLLLSVRLKGTAGTWSDWSDNVVVDTSAPPTATLVITPYDPGTDITTSLTPEVGVEALPSGTATLSGWEARVFDVNDVQVAGGAFQQMGAWTVDPSLINGVDYVVWARAVQVGGARSEWATAPLKVRAVVPGAPTVTLQAATHPTSGVPGVTAQLSFPVVVGGFDYATLPIEIVSERSSDAGATWVVIGRNTPLTGYTEVEITDWAPLPGVVSYRFHAVAHTAGDGVLIGASTTATITSAQVGEWLVPYDRPELGVPVELVELDAFSEDSRMGAAATIGAHYQSITGGTATAASLGCTVRTATPAQEQALRQVLAGRHLLTLTVPPERDADLNLHIQPRVWLRVVGTVSTARVTQHPWTMRLVSFDAEEQPAPYESG